jgi:cardiolipin synthase C
MSRRISTATGTALRPIPADLILGASPDGLDRLAAAAFEARESVAASDYLAAIGASALVTQIMAGDPILEWTEVTLMSDDPAKGLGQADQGALLMGRLGALLAETETSLDVVSAYLIPGRAGTDLFSALAAEGRVVRLLTNSLAATDVPVVHSAWRTYRPELLDAGVTILELRPERDARPRSRPLRHLHGGDLQPACQDLRHRWTAHFRRVVQFRSALGHAQHRDGRPRGKPPDRRFARTGARRTRHGLRGHPKRRRFTHLAATCTGGEETTYTTEPNASLFRRALTRAASWLPVEWIL